MKISALSKHRCHLGEGPVWDPVSASLYWIDSYGPTLYRNTFGDSETDIWHLPGKTVGSLALREQGGLILAMDQGIYSFNPENGKAESIAQPLAGREHLRFNDGKVDPFGSFVTGAMNIDFSRTENCPMYRLSPDFEVTEILDQFTCFNGPCFSSDAEHLYVTGRKDGVIEVFDYGVEQIPRNGRILVDSCNPDGATVDADGYIWSAQWDDACLIRISPDGRIESRLSLPGQIVSSVIFGGPALDLIYVTTTGDEVHGVTPAGDIVGRVLVVSDSGYRGCAEPLFKG